jgi:hypothetical protein
LEKAAWFCWGTYLAFALVLAVAFNLLSPNRIAKIATIDQMVNTTIAILALRALLPLLAGSLMILGTRRFLRRLQRARFQLCPSCLYNLSGLRDIPKCPECGYEIEGRRPTHVWRVRFPNRKRRRARLGS